MNVYVLLKILRSCNMIKLGPVIKFLGCVDANWQLSILVETDASDPSPSMILSKQTIAVPVKLGDLKYQIYSLALGMQNSIKSHAANS